MSETTISADRTAVFMIAPLRQANPATRRIYQMACAGNRIALLASTPDGRCATICQTFGSLGMVGRAKIGVERAGRPRFDGKAPTMRVLADIFATIQLSGTFYFRTHFSPPWGTTV